MAGDNDNKYGAMRRPSCVPIVQDFTFLKDVTVVLSSGVYVGKLYICSTETKLKRQLNSGLLNRQLTFDSTSALWSLCRRRAAAFVSSFRAAMCRAGRRTFPLVSFSSRRETTWSWPCCNATARGVKPSWNSRTVILTVNKLWLFQVYSKIKQFFLEYFYMV